MKRTVFAILFSALATAAQAQGFVTFINNNKMEAWWLRAAFNPMHTEVRGIPVAQIRKSWCKATEFTFDLMPQKEMQEEGSDKIMKEAGLAFAVAGHFDRSKVKQVALTGVYQECAGKKGTFLLIIDEGTSKVRFLHTVPGETQFAVLSVHKNDVVIGYCLECDGGGVLRWSAGKKAFAWVKTREPR